MEGAGENSFMFMNSLCFVFYWGGIGVSSRCRPYEGCLIFLSLFLPYLTSFSLSYFFFIFFGIFFVISVLFCSTETC